MSLIEKMMNGMSKTYEMPMVFIEKRILKDTGFLRTKSTVSQ
jgi:hypothetical protein